MYCPKCDKLECPLGLRLCEVRVSFLSVILMLSVEANFLSGASYHVGLLHCLSISFSSLSELE